jgi:hypothetical protein
MLRLSANFAGIARVMMGSQSKEALMNVASGSRNPLILPLVSHPSYHCRAVVCLVT